MMEDFVKKQLKSPSTAEFPGLLDGRADHVKALGSQTYEVASWVDSQNALGATLRSRFTGKVKQTAEKEWRLLSLEFEEQ